MKQRIGIMVLVIVILASIVPVQAQTPDRYDMPWQFMGASQKTLAAQVATVSTYLGYPVLWPPQKTTGGQLVLWIDTHDDGQEFVRNRILCVLSWVYAQWEPSRASCKAVDA